MIANIPGPLEFPAPRGFSLAKIETLSRPARPPIRVIHPDPMLAVTFTPDRTLAAGWYQLMIRYPTAGLIDALAKITLADGDEFWHRLPVVARNSFLLNIRCSSPLVQMSLILSGSGEVLHPTHIGFERLTRLSLSSIFAKRVEDAIRRDGFAAIGTLWQGLFRLSRPGTAVISGGSATPRGASYDSWIPMFDEDPTRDRQRHIERLQALRGHPRFSILARLGDQDAAAVDRLVGSLVDQIYPEWQLLIAAPTALTDAVRDRVAKIAVDRSIEVLAQAEDYAATDNLLMSRALGDFAIPLPIDAIVRQHALLELALTLDAYPDAALIYSDEDRIGASGKRQNPLFKPAWSPELFNVKDYLANLTVLRRELVLAENGWREGLGLAGDYDLKSRIIDRIGPDKVIHLAKILVHRTLERPPQQAARASTEAVIRDHCARQQIAADIEWTDNAPAPLPRLKYAIPQPPPIVSIIIGTRDRSEILEKCVRSILTLTNFKPYEIIIVDNDSRERATQLLFETLQSSGLVRILPQPGEFNFSALNNAAARVAKGSILCLLNNDVEVTGGYWLTEMVSLAARREIGCVGAKLLYPDGRIQHAGVQLGPGNLAGHGHRFAAADAGGYMDRLRLVQDVSVVTAACLVVRKSVFDQVGGLDEELRVALNDIDFCLKVSAAGYRNVWTPFAELIHHESVSRGRDLTPAKAQRLLAEVHALRRRWGPTLLSDPYYSPHLTYDRDDFSLRMR